MSGRTSEQQAADEALSDAIEAAQKAYYEPVEGVLTTYVVIAKRKWWNEAGEPFTGYYRFARNNDVTLDEQLGLVGYADTRLRKLIAEDD